MTRAEEQLVEAKAQRRVWITVRKKADSEIRFLDKLIESYGRV